jgi:hypothetical protein
MVELDADYRREAITALHNLTRALVKLGFHPEDVRFALLGMLLDLEQRDAMSPLDRLTRLSQEYGLDAYDD